MLNDVIALTTNITYPIPLTHQLICFWHFHQPLTINFTWSGLLTYIWVLLLDLIDEVVLSIIRVVIHNLLGPSMLLNGQIS